MTNPAQRPASYRPAPSTETRSRSVVPRWAGPRTGSSPRASTLPTPSSVALRTASRTPSPQTLATSCARPSSARSLTSQASPKSRESASRTAPRPSTSAVTLWLRLSAWSSASSSTSSSRLVNVTSQPTSRQRATPPTMRTSRSPASCSPATADPSAPSRPPSVHSPRPDSAPRRERRCGRAPWPEHGPAVSKRTWSRRSRWLRLPVGGCQRTGLQARRPRDRSPLAGAWYGLI
jgi:hypothetical protein